MEECCMSNCVNTTENSNEVFYSFPMDFKMCMQWVQNCGKSEFFEDFSYMGACPFITRKICSAHFNILDFLDPTNKYLGLKEKVIPLPNETIVDDNVKEEIVQEEQDNLIKNEPNETIDTQDDSSNFSDELLTPIFESTKPMDAAMIEEQAKLRRQRNALRAALKRKSETPEQRTERKLKDIIRSAKRRQSETELQRQIRRYNDAVRAAYRRSNETTEQRERRRMVDILRAARRRQAETDEQRAARLKADRERAAKRRLMKKLAESGSELSSDSFTCNASLPENFIEPHINLSENLIHHFASVSKQLKDEDAEAVDSIMRPEELVS